MYQHTQAANIAEYIALAAPSLQEKLHQIRDLVHSAARSGRKNQL